MNITFLLPSYPRLRYLSFNPPLLSHSHTLLQVAHTLHSTTSFAILRVDTSSTLTNTDPVNPHLPPSPLIAAKLERVERNRPVKTMTNLPHVTYNLPTDNTDNTLVSASESASSLPLSNPLSLNDPLALTESLLGFVRSHNYAFITALDAHNFR